MATQRDMAWVKSATPEEIAIAYESGELDSISGRVVSSAPDIGSIPGLQRDEEWVTTASPERIAAALDAGELDAYFGRIPSPNSNPDKPSQALYGDGTVVTHTPTARGDIPQVTGPATVVGVGVDPKDSRAPFAFPRSNGSHPSPGFGS